MKKILIAIFALFFSQLAFAEELAWNKHQGPFYELSAGTNLYYVGVIGSEGETEGGGLVGLSLGGALGYSYTPYFGVEGGLLTALLNINQGNQIYAPYLSTRFTMPVGTRFSILAKLGVMLPFVPQDGGLLLPFTAIGGSYAITEKVDLGLQYQGAFYAIVGAGTLGLTLTYHF